MADYFPNYEEPIEEPNAHLLPVLAIEAQCPRDQGGTLVPSELDHLLRQQLRIADEDELSIWRYYVLTVAHERQLATARRLESKRPSQGKG